MSRWLSCVGIVVSALTLSSPAFGAPPVLLPMGPSTTVAPYVIPVAPGVETSALLTVNDLPADDGFRMVGIPDGLGAYRQANGDVEVLMSHGLAATEGIHRYGTSGFQRGAFVSQFVLNPASLRVERGQELLRCCGPSNYNYATGRYDYGQSVVFGRFSSSTLTEPGQLFNDATGRGYRGFQGRSPIYFANEDNGTEGRAFGFTVYEDQAGPPRPLPLGFDGGVQLPRLGLYSRENTVPARNLTDTTVVMGMDDSVGGQVYVYAGTKTSGDQIFGNPFALAGLTNGANHGVRVDGVVDDAAFRAGHRKGEGARFTLPEVNWNQTGAAQQAESTAKGVLAFARPKDGHWDPGNRNDYYFVTAEGGQGTGVGGGGGLWRLRFDDVERPNEGGTLTLLLDGTEGLQSPDDITITGGGNLLIQEDPGNRPEVARILTYRISGGQLATLAQFDPARFAPGANNFTIDEESSGLIDAESLLGPGWFLFNAQVHTATGLPPGAPPGSPGGVPGTVDEYVENGQLLAMRVSDFARVYENGQPPVIVPEVPLTVVLPVSTLSLFAVAHVWRRRRTSAGFGAIA